MNLVVMVGQKYRHLRQGCGAAQCQPRLLVRLDILWKNMSLYGYLGHLSSYCLHKDGTHKLHDLPDDLAGNCLLMKRGVFGYTGPLTGDSYVD